MSNQPYGPIANKIDALYKANLEQNPLWQKATTEGLAGVLTPQQTAEFFIHLFAIQRSVTLAVADEIDKLVRRANPNS